MPLASRSPFPSAWVWKSRVESGDYHHLILETMYPEYWLGSGEELVWAMDLGFVGSLASSVAPVFPIPQFIVSMY
jgi:hypothetical protein